MSGFRLPSYGSELDRARQISFTYARRSLSGYSGDTLASALMANGIQLAGRSFKYHRPRGQVATGQAETNLLMQVGEGRSTTPNVPATLVRLREGLVARPVNCWPSAAIDVASVNSLFANYLSAGFYYKTFKWPSWHTYEGVIRRAAGLGKAPLGSDPDDYEARRRRVDILAIGTGAAQSLGQADPLQNALCVNVSNNLSVGDHDVLADSHVVAILDHNYVLVVERPLEGSIRERLWLIRANRILLSAEAQEQPLIFANNDRPGVMLAGAVKDGLNAHGVLPGRRAVVAANADVAANLADLLAANGVIIEAVVNTDAGDEIIAATGRRSVKGARICTAGQVRRVKCDFIAMSGGFAPSLQLFTQAGGKLRRNPKTNALEPVDTPDSLTLVGETISDTPSRVPAEVLASRKLAKCSFVDFQTDVTVADVQQSIGEGYAEMNHVKRYTVLGMGTDQGRLSGANGSALVADIKTANTTNVLPTRLRPPARPTAFGTLAAGRPPGELFRPRLFMPAHDFHVGRGAVFSDYGWERPSHYPLDGETLFDATQREARAVRTTAGLFDGSPLGKLEFRGAGSGEFLDHIYVGTMSKLKVGRIRYGLMLNENGTIFDDGVVMRLAKDHYLVNCTSGHASRVRDWFDEHLQCEWTLDTIMQDVTQDWATFAIAGPQARKVLEASELDVNLSKDSFPHLSVQTGTFSGHPVRVARVSFSGELSFEVSVPSHLANIFASAIWSTGEPLGLVPYGIEALEVLRVEKGYIHVGADTDSETQPVDIGFGTAWKKKKADFIGRRSLMRPASMSPGRNELVGLRLDDDLEVLPMGAHVLDESGHSAGWVGSSHFSPNVGHGIALATIQNGRALTGQKVSVYSEQRKWTATVTSPTFYDVQNERLNG